MDVVASVELPETVKVVKKAEMAVRSDEKRLEVVAKLAVNTDEDEFVDTKLVVVALVILPLVTPRLVLVPLVTVKLVIVPVVLFS